MTQVVHGMRTMDMPWVQRVMVGYCSDECKKKDDIASISQPSSANKNNHRRMKVVNLINLHIVYPFLVWVFEEFINQLLRSCFYITEAEGFGE